MFERVFHILWTLQLLNVNSNVSLSISTKQHPFGDDRFSTSAKFSEKKLLSSDTHQGVRNFFFSENCRYVLNEWPPWAIIHIQIQW